MEPPLRKRLLTEAGKKGLELCYPMTQKQIEDLILAAFETRDAAVMMAKEQGEGDGADMTNAEIAQVVASTAVRSIEQNWVDEEK